MRDTVRLVVVNETDDPLEFLTGRQPGPHAFGVPFFAGVERLACFLEGHARQGLRDVVVVEPERGP